MINFFKLRYVALKTAWMKWGTNHPYIKNRKLEFWDTYKRTMWAEEYSKKLMNASYAHLTKESNFISKEKSPAQKFLDEIQKQKHSKTVISQTNKFLNR